MDTAIECTDIVRLFGSKNPLTKKQQVKALDGLNLEIPQGIVFGLLGPNGSGKTTTIRILSTLLTPTSGQARVFGFDCVKQTSRVRAKIGLILGGERGLFGRLTGEENLKYFAALSHMNREVTKTRLKEIIELVGLASAGNRLVEQYSRGMRQRLHVARGLLTDPELLFMDEPTIGIDPQGAQEIRQLIPQFVERGKTVLLTTHYMSEADELCAQLAIINHGKIIASGTPSVIKRSFSKVSVCEVICRNSDAGVVETLRNLVGIQRVTAVSDGPVHRLTVQVTPGLDISPAVTEILGEDNIDSLVTRDPTLEEAYLSIIK